MADSRFSSQRIGPFNITGDLAVTGNLTVSGDFSLGAVAVQGLFIGTDDTIKLGNTSASPISTLGYVTAGGVLFALGTVVDNRFGLNVTATLPASTTARVDAYRFATTSSGSAGNIQCGAYFTLSSGYSGASYSIGMQSENVAIGTATLYVTGACNLAGLFTTTGTTAGSNVGFRGFAGAGNINAGAVGAATLAKNSATNIGMIGIALNTGSSPIHVGGFFGLLSAEPTLASSAALFADNGSTTSDIFVCRDNGTAVITIADGGGFTLNQVAVAAGSSAFIVNPGDHTAMTAEVVGFAVQTQTITITGAYSTQKFANFETPLVSAASGLALTTCTTVNIAGAASVTGSADIQNSHCLKIGGNASLGATAAAKFYSCLQVSAHTITFSGTTTINTAPAVCVARLGQITVTNASSCTLDTSATLYILGAPIAAGSITMTKTYSMWIDAGLPRIDSTTANGATTVTWLTCSPGAATVQEWLTIDINGVTRYLPAF